jgi:hypothetical protein
MKSAMKLPACDATCLPLPRLGGKGGPAGPGEGAILSGACRRKIMERLSSRPQENPRSGRVVKRSIDSCGASRRKVYTLSRPCRGTLPRQAGEGKAFRLSEKKTRLLGMTGNVMKRQASPAVPSLQCAHCAPDDR